MTFELIDCEWEKRLDEAFAICMPNCTCLEIAARSLPPSISPCCRRRVCRWEWVRIEVCGARELVGKLVPQAWIGGDLRVTVAVAALHERRDDWKLVAHGRSVAQKPGLSAPLVRSIR